jgi:STAM-binding protein
LTLDIGDVTSFKNFEYPSYPGSIESTPTPTLEKEVGISVSEALPPPLPEKQRVKNDAKIEHKTRMYTEGGEPLRTTFLPGQLRERFLRIAEPNTRANLETCGILCGKLNRNAFFITHLVIPHQISTSDTCTTTNEELLFDFVDKNDLFILGWIHTHPTQSCFLSSIDLHTQSSYQIMLPEAVAIVCAPQHEPSWGVFRLTNPPGIDIIKSCPHSLSFHPHNEANLYKTAYLPGHILIKDSLPFQLEDLRNK